MTTINGLSPLALGRAQAAQGLAAEQVNPAETAAADNRDWFNFSGWNDMNVAITGAAASIADRGLATESVLSHLVSG